MMALRRLIDIGANLTDPMFFGIYHGTKRHETDLDDVLERAWDIGIDKIIITGGSLNDSKKAIDLSQKSDKLYVTVGCHPTKCNDFTDSDPDKYYQDLLNLIKNNRSKVVAVGEIGLDYDRLNFCDKETQKKYFRQQLNLSTETGLPLFLHCRNADEDFLQILSDFPNHRGVVHSFDGTKSEADNILEKGFYIGVNGCSLKTENNLQVVKDIPVSRLMIETDAPWCEVRPSHAGFKYVNNSFKYVKKEKWQKGAMIKSRNEPATLIHVLGILSIIKGMNLDTLGEQLYKNTIELFLLSNEPNES